MSPTRKRTHIAWLLTILFLGSAPQAHAAAVEVLPITLPSPHHVAVENGGSRLKAHDSIVICAKDLTTMNDPGDPLCRSVRNNTDNDIFVPWRTPEEWSAFLTAAGAGEGAGWLDGIYVTILGYACMPQTGTDVCGGKIVIDQLGTRAAGYIEGDREHYGAQDDVFGPIVASSVLEDGAINYSTTYVCDKGVWVQTKASGSCGPMDGACGDNTSILMADDQYYPTKMDSLCSTGSILANLSQVFSNGSLYGWTWSCLGTPGRSAASCAARAIIASPGICGGASGQTLSSPPDASMLCAYGTPSTTTFNSGATTWTWQCVGDSSVSLPTVSCSASNSNPATAGVCYGNGWTYKDIDWGMDKYCLTGALSELVLPDIDNGISKWTWKCQGVNGGAPASCYANLNINGSCSFHTTGDNGIFTDFDKGPSTSTDIYKLCNPVGMMTEYPAPNPGVVFNSSTNTWTWTCPGYGAGKPAVCTAYYIPDYAPPACSAINNSYVQGLWDGSRFNVCVNGVCGYPPFSSVTDYCASGKLASNSFSYNTTRKQWEWECNWPPTSAYTWCYINPTNPPADGVCGSASGAVSVDTPDTAHLCSSPTTQPSYSVVDGKFVWTCEGTSGGKSVNCSVPGVAKANGTCGTTNGTYIPDPPDKNLCNSGTPSSLTYSDSALHGPWTWTCNGVGGGTTSSCKAYQCSACSGNYSAATSGSVSISLNHNGCTMTGAMDWSATSSILRMANMTASGTVSGIGSFSGISVSIPNAPQAVCPPCFLTPGSNLSANIVFSKAEGSFCTESDTSLIGSSFPVSNLVFQ